MPSIVVAEEQRDGRAFGQYALDQAVDHAIQRAEHTQLYGDEQRKSV